MAGLITHLRHVNLAVPDFKKQSEFFGSIFGLVNVAEDGAAYFAAEGSPESYVVRVREGEKRLDLIAYGAQDRESVDELAVRLARAGVQIIHEPRPLDDLGGGYGFRFFDIDGRTIEVSCDVESREHRKIEERESIPVRLSHVVVNSPDPERTRFWYEEHLEFKLSDTLVHPQMGELMWFMRCNPQHHSFAVARGPHTSVHHVSFELRGLDEYMRGSGRLIRHGIPKIWGPGRHVAGDNTFSYFLDPSGNTLEYTTELSVLDEDTWHPTLIDVGKPENQDQWGTANPFDEIVAKESFNDPDHGVFVAPPI